MVPFALGTQTLGSVLRPASYCGVTGFKATFGLFSLEGVLQNAQSLDTLGFFTHTPGDMLRLWNVNKEAFDSTWRDLREMAGTSVADPQVHLAPAHFTDVLGEALAFPVHATDDAESKRLMQEFFERHMEDTWLHKPVRSLPAANSG